MQTRKSSKFWLALVIFSLVGQVAWVLRDAEQILNPDCTYSFVPSESIFQAAFIDVIFIWIMFIPLFREIRKEY